MKRVAFDCRYFVGDRPCGHHKKEGFHCEKCPHYRPVRERILVVKLDAVGDVLRTTCILPGLRERYPDAQITWITKAESVPLFEGNPYVDRIFDVGQAFYILQTDEFDMVINLDAAPLSARLASIARGKTRMGFGYDPRGFVYPLHPEAEEWFLMGIFDDVKKKNKRSYQSIMLQICGLEPSDYSIQYTVKPEEAALARKFAEQNGLQDSDIIVGLNTGAGMRWEKKRWTEDGFIELIRLLKRRYPDVKILLYGGPEEVGRNSRILSKNRDFVIDTGCDNSIRSFAALLNLSALIVTGDTMALHLAVALKKKVAALVGPTSAAELELYVRGVKITADLPCLCCYRMNCDKAVDCMNSIRPEQVIEAIGSLL